MQGDRPRWFSKAVWREDVAQRGRPAAMTSICFSEEAWSLWVSERKRTMVVVLEVGEGGSAIVIMQCRAQLA